MSEISFPKVEDARRVSVADIVQHIVQHTVQLGLEPGDRLPPERQLVEMLGVGRSPLREALKSLDILGFIEIRQGDGTYLTARATGVLPQVVSWGLLLGTRQAQELIEARLFIEVSLARLAAARRTDADIERLAVLVTEMSGVTTAEAFATADTAFHLTIAHAANNSALASVVESIKSLLDVWIVRVVDSAPDRSALVLEHRAIADAIAAQDADMAATRMDAHITSVTERLRATLNGARTS